MQMSLRVSELLCEAEIDDVDLVAMLVDPHEEVIRLNIPVDEVSGVNVFNL